MIYPSVSSEENSGLFWADGEALPGYLSPYLDDASFQKVNAEGVRWKQYEKQGDVLQLPEWRENFKAVLGDWCQMLSEDVEQFQGQIRHYFEGEQRRREAVEDGDVVSGRNAEDEKRFKEESLSFAGKLAAASAAAENMPALFLMIPASVKRRWQKFPPTKTGVKTTTGFCFIWRKILKITIMSMKGSCRSAQRKETSGFLRLLQCCRPVRRNMR